MDLRLVGKGYKLLLYVVMVVMLVVVGLGIDWIYFSIQCENLGILPSEVVSGFDGTGQVMFWVIPIFMSIFLCVFITIGAFPISPLWKMSIIGVLHGILHTKLLIGAQTSFGADFCERSVHNIINGTLVTVWFNGYMGLMFCCAMIFVVGGMVFAVVKMIYKKIKEGYDED